MTIKSALSVVALAAALSAGPVLAQDMMIGSQTVAEADVEAVKARCLDLQTAAETESLTAESDSETETDDAVDNETAVAGDAEIANEPALTESPTALSIDLAVVTLEDCEAGGWFDK
jgi:hypothetical protein